MRNTNRYADGRDASVLRIDEMAARYQELLAILIKTQSEFNQLTEFFKIAGPQEGQQYRVLVHGEFVMIYEKTIEVKVAA